jgi:hypothetical protein
MRTFDSCFAAVLAAAVVLRQRARRVALHWLPAWLIFALGILHEIRGGVETTTTLSTELKEFYPGGGIINQLNVDTYLLDKVDKAKGFINIEGRYWYKPGRFGLAGAAGSRAEGGALPSSSSMTIAAIQVSVRYHYGVIEVTGPAIAASKTDRGAFKRALQYAMDGMYEEFRFTINVLLHGYGTAIMGVTSSVAGSVITLTDNVLPPNWFKLGLKIDSYVGTTTTVRQAGMRITDVDLPNKAVTVDTIGATAAGDRIYLAGSKDVAPLGLLSSVDDGTYVAVHFNVDRTAVGRKDWKSYVNANGTPAIFGNAARRTLTEVLLQQVLDEQRIRAGGARAIDLFYSSLGVRRAFFAQLDPDRRYNSSTYDGGWKALKYQNGDDDVMWVGDEHALRYTVFGLNTSVAPNNQGGKGRPSKIEDEEKLSVFQTIDPDWDDSTGSQLKQMYSGGNLVDSVTAFYKWYLNWGSCRPNEHARVDDIFEPTG